MLKIFISNLKEYNNEKIIGEWVSLPCEGLEEVLNKISNNGKDILTMKHTVEIWILKAHLYRLITLL